MPARLAAHPRLYVSPDAYARLAQPAAAELLRRAETAVAKQAHEFVRTPKFDWILNTHNAHLVRARIMQTRVVVLLVQWRRTGQERFRRAAWDHLCEMGAWRFWSWITWRQGNSAPLAIFDLSYGENAATLALGYDALFDTLSAGERAHLERIARERALAPFLHQLGLKQPPWWFRSAHSNWNSVCAGGAGMLALATYEALPEARKAVPLAERSMIPFMHALKTTRGAWPEGIGYWNYGMRYAFMYLLSHERATGRAHPLLKGPDVRRTLEFPLDFCPNAVPCSFGDVNRWTPLPFHYAAAERLERDDLFPELDRHAERMKLGQGTWPNAAELLLLHPRRKLPASRTARPYLKLYRGMDWGLLADRWPSPAFAVAVRGGAIPAPHGHRDLLSFHAVVGDEPLIENIGVGEYLDTTFSSRRYELFETMPASKNTILINGVGVAEPSRVKTRPLDLGRDVGLLLDARSCMGGMRDGPSARFCARLFLLLEGKALLIVDRVVTPHPARIESRLHTYAKVTAGKNRARIAGRRHRLQAAFASNLPAGLFQARTAPTTPGPSAAVLRWCTEKLHQSFVFATLLVPGSTPARVELDASKTGIRLSLRAGAWSRKLRLSLNLQPGGRA
ncbi:MAG: heparinase II/III family protein [Planctomycetes bacterium]|nr:heparinase II/III family protein [Planctomycetota bacterium]